MTEDLEQGSEAWRLARCGSLGASRIHEVVARTKTGPSAMRANCMGDLIAERLMGVPLPKYVSSAMQHGTDTEAEARAAYEFDRDVDVALVGLIRHPRIDGTHASPDGLVDADGIVEIKCPQIPEHINTLLNQTIPGKYVTQIQWQLGVTGRAWADYVSYCPMMPTSMQLWIKRVERDPKAISDLEEQIQEFLHELDAKVKALREKYETRELAA